MQEMKTCAKCKRGLPRTAECFYRAKNKKDGFEPQCKRCMAEAARKRRQKNPEEVRRRNNESYRRRHPEKEPVRKWYELDEPIEKTCTKCKEVLLATTEFFYTNIKSADGLQSWCKKCTCKYQGEYGKEKREHIRKREKKKYQEDPEPHLKYQKEYRVKNPKKVRGYERKSYEKRMKEKPEEVRRARRKHEANRRAKNPAVRVSKSISAQINRSLKDGKGGRHWEELVGYALEDLMKHLESQFEPGMTWDNWGDGLDDWHIDHVRPLATFAFESADDPEFLQCWSLWNLQPLWKPDNQRKSKKFQEPPLPLTH